MTGLKGIGLSLLELDLTRKPYIFILIVFFLLSRIPLLNLGFGEDADAWRIANSAFDLKNLHAYHPSRFPGYPLPEYVDSLIIDYGWIATNSLTTIISLGSVIFFAMILKELNVRNKGLLTLTYAFLPVLWVNSTTTMDYMWALTFIIITWYYIIKNKYVSAGIAMGLAIGSRITSAVLLFPFYYLIWTESKRIKNVAYFSAATFGVAFTLFSPLFIKYGLNFLTYHRANLTFMEHLIYVCRGVKLFGVDATLIGMMFLVSSSKRLFKEIIERDRIIIFSLLSILLVFGLFIYIPDEYAYLIPVTPFVLLVCDRILLKREFLLVFCILLLSNSFVTLTVDVDKNYGNLTARFVIDEGSLIRSIKERQKQMIIAQYLLNLNINRSVLIVGWYTPILTYLSKSALNEGIVNYENGSVWRSEKDVWYHYLLSLNNLQDLQNRGYTIYYIEGIRDFTKKVYGYDLNEYGCEYLSIASSK